MKTFLIDDKQQYNYGQLLNRINSDTSYYPVFQTPVLYDYFVNFLKAIALSRPLTLIDSDTTIAELTDQEVQGINCPIALDKYRISSIEELIDKILKSESTITIFTSGTTGQPKKVSHSIKNLTRAVRKNERHADDIWAYAYNPTHMAGLQVFFQAFANENILVNVFNKNRQYVYEKIDEYQITHLSATPTFYRLLLPYEKEYSSVKRVTFGGEKSNHALYDSVLKIFPNAKINNIYASTEAGSLFAARGDAFQIPQGMESMFKVEEGELLIHKSLLGQSDDFEYKGDFYCSGDIVDWVDESKGLFKFKSRKNESLNIGGYKVNPEEVEEAISTIHGVQQVKVYGRSNSILGTILCADIKKDTKSELSDIEIRRILSKKLQDYKVPRKIKFVDEFELTRTGKLQRK